MTSQSFRVLLALHLLSGCAVAVEPPGLDAGGFGSRPAPVPTPAPIPSGGSGAVAGAPRLPVAGVGGQAGSTGGTLTSDVFGSGQGGSAGGASIACDATTPGVCDWTRVDGCCKALACDRANRADVFNMYPVESCEALVECVQANPGCSTATDPLCFQNESPSAPCLQQGYRASHLEPEGPFAWTADLVSCVCGY